MTVALIIEASPGGQAGDRRVFEDGELVIGRGDDADWRIADPEMYVSRKHVMISMRSGKPQATDMSRGGVFVDGSDQPLGPGNSCPLEDGMRLRLGDVVLRVEVAGHDAAAEAETPRRSRFAFDPPEEGDEPEPRPSRPETLPDPFGLRSDREPRRGDDTPRPPPQPLDREDPFGLDLKPAAPEERPRSADAGKRRGYFDTAPESATDPEPAREPEPAPRPAPVASHRQARPPEPEIPLDKPATQPTTPRDDRGAAPADDDLRAALLRGMGLDPARFPADDPEAEMEEIGRRFRALVDGLMQMLRTRALEKDKVRVARTVIASADVNPLKFLATPEDVVGALIAPRSAGYLPPDAAIDGAFRDLADHQVRTWTALQSSLRRMVDQFDPKRIEGEMERAGRLEALLAGGRSAMLWRLYQERYHEIAKSAEERFLGEVGADFRDAYEGYRREK